MEKDNKCDSHEKCMEQLSKHETLLDTYGKWMEDLTESIKELRDKLVGRPSWLVTIVLTSLSTLSVSLIVYIATKGA